MSAAELRWDGPLVAIVQGGVTKSVTYRHAVSLVSRGLATWAPVEEPKKAPSKREKAPQKPAQQTADPEGARLPSVPQTEPTVSNPATGAEVDQAGYEPPLPDL